MKIALASDLHFEFQESRILSLIETLEKDTDIFILAGDIQVFDYLIEDLKYISNEFPNTHIVYIAGNHEFYGHDITDVQKQLIETFADHPRIHYLEKSVFELNNVVFIGTTLWTGFNAYDYYYLGLSKFNAEKGIGDFHEILYEGKAFTPNDCESLFIENRNWLSKELKKYKQQSKHTVVITHFPPSTDVQHETIPISSLSNYFQANCRDIIEQYQPNYWIYGHNHWSGEKEIGDTTLISNQLGYPNELCNTEKLLKYIQIGEILHIYS